MYLGNQNIFLLLMRYIFGVRYEWKIFIFQLFPKFLLSFSPHSCDTSALEVGKRNKACILKTAGIEVHLLLQKMCVKHTKRMLTSSGGQDRLHYMLLCLVSFFENPHSQNTHHRMAIWQLGVFNVIYPYKKLKITPNSSAKQYLFHIMFPLSVWSSQLR